MEEEDGAAGWKNKRREQGRGFYLRCIFNGAYMNDMTHKIINIEMNGITSSMIESGSLCISSRIALSIAATALRTGEAPEMAICLHPTSRGARRLADFIYARVGSC